MSWFRGGSRRVVVLVAVVAVVVAGLLVSRVVRSRGTGLQDGIDLDRMLTHLEGLQQIADENGGNRAAGEPGYQASVDYVVEALEAAGYRPEVQEFPIPYLADSSELMRLGAAPLELGRDFLGPQEPGAAGREASGAVVGVDLMLPPGGPDSSTSGCEAADFTGFPAGAIALVQRGSCAFGVKIEEAERAGAAGVIIMNEGQPERMGLFRVGAVPGLSVPVVSVTHEVGLDLAGGEVRISNEVVEETRPCYNVIAQTPGSEPVVMVGAHLDSVWEGPGIDDNGSGSAALLALAEQRPNLDSAVRFGWWGAEEIGLLGSTYYVNTLPSAERAQIAGYLNVDMIASPNYTIGVYDGDGSLGPPWPTPEGSAEIEAAFAGYFREHEVAFEETATILSDHFPFAQAGIPVGGLFTGAGEVKSDAQAEQFGGMAGHLLDPCYHQPCDSLTGGPAGYPADGRRGNIHVATLKLNADALAAVLVALA